MKPTRITIGALLLALGTIAALAVVLALPATAAAPEDGRTLTVVGSGAINARPDVAEWSFGVTTTALSAGEALAENSAAMQEVIAALAAAGIARDDLRTEQVSVFREVHEAELEIAGAAVADGFNATNTVHATVRDVEAAGSVIDAVVAAGANQVFGPTLSVSSSESLYAQALDRAYDAALAKARELAEHAGLTLGEPISVEEAGSSPIVVAAHDEAAEATPIEPGQARIEATVTVTYTVS